MRGSSIVGMLLTIILIAVSCRYVNDDRDVIHKWTNKEINFPDSAVYFSLNDTIQIDINKYKLKILTYNDASGCIPCQLKLNEWNEFINFIHTFVNDKVLIIKYIAPHRLSTALFELKNANYEHPVCIDLDDKFNSINQLPGDKSLRCFLIDDKNRVLLIGDPVNNRKIRDLYIKTICNRLCICLPEMLKDSDRLVHHLGVFNMREEQHTSFVIYNDDIVPMHIDSLFTSCECTKATLSKKDVLPYDSVVIDVTYNADLAGSFLREIYMDVRDRERFRMVIEGNAIE